MSEYTWRVVTCRRIPGYVRFINDEILPGNLAKHVLSLEQTFVGSDDNIKLALAVFERQILCHELVPFVLGASHFDDTNRGTPLVKFSDPVPNDRFGDNDDVRSTDSSTFA
jgi:hypothetical protein